MRHLLKAGLRRLAAVPAASPRYQAGTRRATVIAVAARKGGVGKTTTSVSLAAALARFHGQKVLLIDLDPQGHVNTALRAQVGPSEKPISSVLLDERGAEILDCVVPTAIPNLDVTGLDLGLAATEDLMGTRIGKEVLLRDALKITRTHYDTIVIDCPPNLGNLSVNGLVAADQVLIPCDPSPLSLKGVTSLIDTITTISNRLNPDIDLLGILLTRVDGRNVTVNEAIVKEIEETYGTALLPMRIGVSTDLSKAQMEGRDVFAYDQGCRGAMAYRELAEWVAEA